jgi:hypothetical protein
MSHPDDITFLTFQNTRKYPYPDIPLSIVINGILQDPDPSRVILHDLHERLHLNVGDHSRNIGVVILDQMKGRIMLMQILLKKFGTALQEDETTD